MENTSSDLRQKIIEMISPFNLFLVVLEMVFIVLMVMGFSNIMNEPEGEVGIGTSEISEKIEGTSEGLDDDISKAVYEAVAVNNSEMANVSRNGVIVRDEIVVSKEMGDSGLRHMSFIVDIPELKQSYRVFYDDYSEVDKDDLSGGAPEILVTCLNGSDEMIYDDFSCGDNYGGLGKYYVARGHEGLMGGGSEQVVADYKVFLPQDRYYDGEIVDEAYLEITAYCGEESAEEKAVNNVGEFFRGLGLDLNDFKYKIVTECEYYNEDEQ